MLQHFWVNVPLFLGAIARVYFMKKTKYRLIPVLTFLKYRYFTGPGIENSIPNWKHYLPESRERHEKVGFFTTFLLLNFPAFSRRNFFGNSFEATNLESTYLVAFHLCNVYFVS
jgi:hypothetical protein